MQKFILLSLILTSIISGCAPQVAPPEATATLPPPTATIIPTPTSHPQFIALQEQIAAAGERFTLNPDGTVLDGATIIPGLHVGKDGKIILIINGEKVEVDPASMKFDNENGLSIDGYEDPEGDGDFAEVVKELTPEQTAFVAQMSELRVDASSYTCSENGKCKDVEEKVVFESNRANFEYLQPLLEKSGALASTNIIPLGPSDAQEGTYVAPREDDIKFTRAIYLDFKAYMTKKNGSEPFGTGQAGSFMVMLDPSKNSWGIVVGEHVDRDNTVNQYLVFRYIDVNGQETIMAIPVNKMSFFDGKKFWIERSKQ